MKKKDKKGTDFLLGSFRFKGIKIKEPNYLDLRYINRPKKVKALFGLRTKTRQVDAFDMIDRLQEYILNNSNPRLDINDMTPKDVNNLFGKLTQSLPKV